MNVGFIGMGQMGAGMTASLLRAGHKVMVYNRSPEKTRPLVALGATAATDIGDACDGEVVFTMLADDRAIESVTLGEGGILKELGRGEIHISCSTISVALSERLARAHAEANLGFIAAPVFGRPEAAAAGKLFVIAGGAASQLQRVTPLFDAIGQRTFVVSEQPQLANLVKLSGNFLIASVIEILGEAMALADKGGIDRHQYLDLLTATLFGAPVFKTYGALIADRKFEPPGFATPLGLKDIRLALSAADTLSVPMPVASLLRDRFLTLAAHGGSRLDWSAIGYLPAVDAGAPYL